MERLLCMVIVLSAIVYTYGFSQTYNTYSESGDSYNKYLNSKREGDGFKRFKELGAVLVGKGLRYREYYYGIRCDKIKFYRQLNACYDRFYGLKYCLYRLSTEGLLGRRHIHQWYGRGYGLGVKFVKRGIIYHHTYYRRLVKRKVFLEYLTKCERTYYSAKVCVQMLVKKHVLTTTHIQRKHVTVTRIGGNVHQQSTASSHATHHVTVNGKTVHTSQAHALAHAAAGGGHSNAHAYAFAFVNGMFKINGINYKLNCSPKQFYYYWNLCLRYFRNNKRCFGLLYQRHLFIRHKSAAVTTHAVLHPFRIVARKFNYHGKDYRLRCSKNRFYNHWDSCNKHYSQEKCFAMLERNNLMQSYSTSTASSQSTSHVHVSVNGKTVHSSHAHAAAHAHASSGNGGKSHAQAHAYAFSITDGKLKYHGKVYELSCNQKDFYQEWDRCIGHYHDNEKCFTSLKEKHLFS